MDKMKVEVCAFTLQSAVNAQKAGAYRVELCDNILEGGTTPSYGMIELACKYLQIKINVLIRPRGGDFCYSDLEFENIIKDIHAAKQIGADGIVTGALTPEGTIDKIKMNEIISAAGALSVTFHRAFDYVKDPFDSLNTLIELGVDRVLTSGLKNSALEGKAMLAALVDYSGGRIVIMPGGGINYYNIEELVNITKAKEYHLSGKSLIVSKMIFRNDEVKINSTSFIPENDYVETDISKIKAVVDLLNKF